jgi:hypothetical protein
VSCRISHRYLLDIGSDRRDAKFKSYWTKKRKSRRALGYWVYRGREESHSTPETRSEPFVWERWSVARFPISGLRHRHQGTEGEKIQLSEWRSGEKTRIHPSEEDRLWRSKDLAKSEVRRVRTQTLGAPSCEDARSEKKDNCWI